MALVNILRPNLKKKNKDFLQQVVWSFLEEFILFHSVFITKKTVHILLHKDPKNQKVLKQKQYTKPFLSCNDNVKTTNSTQ